MGIHINTLSGSLFQKFLQIVKVMAGNENTFALPVPQGDLRGCRLPEFPGVSGIKQLHSPQVDLAAPENKVYPLFQAEAFTGDRGQGLVDIGINGVILLAKYSGMVRIG